MIRDQILATSGLLNRRHVRQERETSAARWPVEIGQHAQFVSPHYEPDTGDKIYRRSLYTFWKRGMPPPQMTILNAPTREACIARRERTNTPLQALLLMNEPEYLESGSAPRARTIATSR